MENLTNVLLTAASQEPTGMDSLGAVIALIVISVGGLVLIGMGGMMAVGAIIGNRSYTTSWPDNYEHAFRGFEDRAGASQSKAWLVALVSGLFVLVAAVGISQGVEPDRRDLSKDMNMSNLTKKSATTDKK
jgi:hypothetical protein